MARVIWTEPALRSLEDIAEYIALDKPEAATRYVRRVLETVERLADFPNSGSVPPEIPELPYRQVIVAPCRILYRFDVESVWIIHICRGEQLLDADDIEDEG